MSANAWDGGALLALEVLNYQFMVKMHIPKYAQMFNTIVQDYHLFVEVMQRSYERRHHRPMVPPIYFI